MITRITSQTQLRHAQSALYASLSQLTATQDKATSRQNISRPSDDPTGTANALAVRSSQSANAQYTRNATDGNTWLTMVDSSLSSVEAIMQRVRDLTVAGANDGSLSQTAKDALADELDGLKGNLLSLANTQVLGRNIFAGTSDAAQAFRVDTTPTGQPDYVYTGTPGDSVQRRIGQDVTVRVDGDGAAVFGVGSDSAFALIDQISSDLRSAVNVGPRLAQIDDRMTSILAQHAVIGGAENQVQRAQNDLSGQSVTLEAQRSSIEDVDLGTVILDLQTKRTNYQAALYATAQALPATLMDFLR